ncbi:hypothetical protein AVEN_9411-2-1, partial [Araneus ventricosus]
KFISIANACRVVPSNWPKKEKGEWLLRRILNHLSESCTAERGLRQGDSLTCLQQTKQLRSRTLNVDVQRALETFERKGKLYSCLYKNKGAGEPDIILNFIDFTKNLKLHKSFKVTD